MFCKLSLLTVLAGCVHDVLSAQTNFKLYAYGSQLGSGLQLFYGDGKAYVGQKAPSFVSQAVNITLSQSEGESMFVANPDNSTNWPSARTMYVDVTEGAVEPVGFALANETLRDGKTTSGFGLYGGWAFHKQNSSAIEMKFIATPTNETDIYLVKWNGRATVAKDDIAIALRTQTPTAINDQSKS